MTRRLATCCLFFGLLGFATPSIGAAADESADKAAVTHLPGVDVHYVTRRVCVPQVTMEKRTVRCVEYRPETREYTHDVVRCIPETKQVTREVCLMVPELRKRTETFTACIPVTKWVEREMTVRVPVWREVERQCPVQVPVWSERVATCTVNIPHQEKHLGTRTVCKTVPVKQTRTVCVDEGHWEERQVSTGCPRNCGSCSRCAKPCVTTCKVWVPKMVKKEVEETVYRTEYEEQPCEYMVTVFKPETRSRTVQVCNFKTEFRTVTHRVCDYKLETKTCKVPVCEYRYEEQTRDVCFTVCVPKTVTQVCNVTTYKQVVEKRTDTCTVMIPTHVEREVEVPVCKMVTKTIQVPVCIPRCCR